MMIDCEGTGKNVQYFGYIILGATLYSKRANVVLDDGGKEFRTYAYL